MSPIDEIKSKLSITDVIAEYNVKLTPAGSNLRALCPFHHEKTPSFMVSPEKQIFKCFGCGISGDQFAFIKQIEGVEFPEALRILANKAGVVLRREDPALQNQKTRLYDLMRLAADFFNAVLVKWEKAQLVREYLSRRGLDELALQEFRLGYSPDSWDALSKFLRKKGFTEKEIIDSGLVVLKSSSETSQSRERYYDRFRNRIMFPIWDTHGEVVGFGARILENVAVEAPSSANAPTGQAKYINTPQTLIYNKSHLLYGLDRAKQEIRQQKSAIVVEGYMDVIACHTAGFKNVVASSGTSLTREQLLLIKRYTSNLLLAFDFDEAGFKAAERGIDLALELGMNIKIVQVPKGKDPDECIREDKELFQRAVLQSQNIMDYYFDITFRNLDLNRVEHKKQGAKVILPIILKIQDPIEQTHYLQRLGSMLRVSEEVLRSAMPRRIRSSPARAGEADSPRHVPGSSIERRDQNVILLEHVFALLLKFPTIFQDVKNTILSLPISEEDTGSAPIYELYFFFRDYYNNNITSEIFNLGEFRNKLIPELLSQVDILLLFADKEFIEMDPVSAIKEIEISSRALYKNYLHKEIDKVSMGLKEAERQIEEQAVDDLSATLKDLTEKLRELAI